MEIINIVTCSLNSVDSITSFVVADPSKRTEMVQKAEQEFERQAREMGYDEDDDPSIEALLEDGYFNNGNKCLCISWSDKVVKSEDENDQLKEAFDLLRAVLTESGVENEFDKDIHEFLKRNKQVTEDYVPYWEE